MGSAPEALASSPLRAPTPKSPNHREAVAHTDHSQQDQAVSISHRRDSRANPPLISGEERRGAVPNRAGGFARINGLDPQHHLPGDQHLDLIRPNAVRQTTGALWEPYETAPTEPRRTRPPFAAFFAWSRATALRRWVLPAATAASTRTKFIECQPHEQRSTHRTPLRVP